VLFGILSAAGIIAGIATCSSNAQSVKQIDSISIAIFFIIGITFGGIAIILNRYNRKNVPSTDPD
jgi:hypothetical protein